MDFKHTWGKYSTTNPWQENQVPKFDEEGNVTERVTVVSDTKTACSVREVPLPDILIKALEDYKKRQWLIGKENNIDLLAPEVFIFANNDGSVRSYSGMKSILERFLKAHELDKYGIHFHGLRHTYSNMLFKTTKIQKSYKHYLVINLLKQQLQHITLLINLTLKEQPMF